MKKEKLKLQELKVESFTTKIDDAKVKGGVTPIVVIGVTAGISAAICD